MKIVTFNLRIPSEWDEMNHFENRKGLILKKIEEEQPELIGFQEAKPEPMMFFKKHLPDYTVIFNSRTADFKGEGLAIAYRKDCIELQTLDRFWLSPTPQIPESRYEDQSNCARICQVALLHNTKTDTMFRIYNVHLDHVGQTAQVEGMKLVLDRIKQDAKINFFPLFLLGDFNVYPDSEPIRACLDFEEVKLIDTTADITGSYHDYGELEQFTKIDYIFTDEATAARAHTVTPWTDQKHGIYLSDHYPICLEI